MRYKFNEPRQIDRHIELTKHIKIIIFIEEYRELKSKGLKKERDLLEIQKTIVFFGKEIIRMIEKLEREIKRTQDQ